MNHTPSRYRLNGYAGNAIVMYTNTRRDGKMPEALVLSEMKHYAETAYLVLAFDGGIRRKELRAFLIGKKFQARLGNRPLYFGNSLTRAVNAYNKAEGR